MVCGRWLQPLLLAACSHVVTSLGGPELFKQSELAKAGIHSKRFCDALKRDHCAIIELSECNRPEMVEMWSYAADFFALPAVAKIAMGPLDEPEFSEEHLGQPRLFGFTQMSANDCLDTRLRRRPASTLGVHGTLEVVPRELESSLPGATTALVKAQRVLFDLGMMALRVVTEDLGDKLERLGSTAENVCCRGGDLPEGATSATVHRFIRYVAAAREEEVEEEEASSRSADSPLAFPAHTDGTWLSMIPCAAQPGLEVRTASGWVSLEAHGRHGIDVAVLTGDFLQSLSQFEYTAASHRVLRPQPGDQPRLSAPLLMRAAASYREQCKRADARRRSAGSTAATPRVDRDSRPEGSAGFKEG